MRLLIRGCGDFLLEADRSPSLVRLRFLSGVGLEPATHTVRTRSLSNYPTPRGLACLAQLVERKTLNLVVVGSSPTVGTAFDFVSFASAAFMSFVSFVSFVAFAAGR